MASNKGGGPGTYTNGGVRCTMDPPFAKASKSGAGGTMDRNKAPFDKPHDTGGGGIPLVFYDDMKGTPNSTPAPGQVAPSQQGGKRVGTKEYPFGGGNMRDGKSKY